MLQLSLLKKTRIAGIGHFFELARCHTAVSFEYNCIWDVYVRDAPNARQADRISSSGDSLQITLSQMRLAPSS